MKRILLCLEDYNELIFLQTSLKKLGFDVEGIQNPRTFSELLMTFNPRLVFITKKGKQIDGEAMVAKINRPTGLPRLVFIDALQQNSKNLNADDYNVDDIIESPINIRTVLKLTAMHTDTSEESLMAKYEKIFAKGKEEASERIEGDYTEESEVIRVGGAESVEESEWVKSSKANLKTEERSERFAAVLSQVSEEDKVVKTLDRKSVAAYTKKLRKAQSPNPTDVDVAKREFVDALFDKTSTGEDSN